MDYGMGGVMWKYRSLQPCLLLIVIIWHYMTKVKVTFFQSLLITKVYWERINHLILLKFITVICCLNIWRIQQIWHWAITVGFDRKLTFEAKLVNMVLPEMGKYENKNWIQNVFWLLMFFVLQPAFCFQYVINFMPFKRFKQKNTYENW